MKPPIPLHPAVFAAVEAIVDPRQFREHRLAVAALPLREAELRYRTLGRQWGQGSNKTYRQIPSCAHQGRPQMPSSRVRAIHGPTGSMVVVPDFPQERAII